MPNRNSQITVAGSKTGILQRSAIEKDGEEESVSRTGMIRRKKVQSRVEAEKEHHEPPQPPSLPEMKQDDGGTTGVVRVSPEGDDAADREDHTHSA